MYSLEVELKATFLPLCPLTAIGVRYRTVVFSSEKLRSVINSLHYSLQVKDKGGTTS